MRDCRKIELLRRAFDARYESVIQLASQADIVLLGEATHGTAEFYRSRAEITKTLIAEHGFAAVVAEADWPDAYWANHYVRGLSDDSNADEALAGFKRFPKWVWRNREVLEFIEWLRAYNDGSGDRKAGFDGTDLYSLNASMEAVIEYLTRVDSDAARRARFLFRPFRRRHAGL